MAQVAEVMLQRQGAGVPVRKHESGVRLDTRNFDQSVRRKIQRVAIQAGVWHIHQTTIESIGPAVIGAAEALRMTAVKGADLGAAMTAAIEVHADARVRVADHEYRILAHELREVVAGCREHGLMGHEQPAAAKHAVEFQPIDRLIVEDERIDASRVYARQKLVQIESHVGLPEWFCSASRGLGQ